jgi:hypothetical protein
MTDVLQHLSQNPSVEISIGSGIENWRTGEITLTVRGNGEVRVHNRASGHEHTYTAALDAARVEDLGQFLLKHRMTQLKKAEQVRSPSDVPIWFRIRQANQVIYEAESWHAERYNNDDLDMILTYADELIEEVTGGVLPFGKTPQK